MPKVGTREVLNTASRDQCPRAAREIDSGLLCLLFASVLLAASDVKCSRHLHPSEGMIAETLDSWNSEYGGAPAACAVFAPSYLKLPIARVIGFALNAHLRSFVQGPFAPTVEFFQRRGCPVHGHFKRKLFVPECVRVT